MAKPITLEYMQQYLKDYEAYDMSYIIRKYNFINSHTARKEMIKYKKRIKTFSYPTFFRYCKTVSDRKITKLLKLLEMSDEFDFCLKHEVRYPISAKSKMAVRNLLGLKYVPKPNTVRPSSEYMRKIDIIKDYDTYGAKYVQEKYGYKNITATHIIVIGFKKQLEKLKAI